MLVTITPKDDPSMTLTLVDGASWLNHTWQDSQLLALEKDGLDGWYDSPGTKNADIADNPAGNGGYTPYRLLLDNRVVTIRGQHRSGRRAGSITESGFRDRLAWLVGRHVDLTIDDPAGRRTAHGVITSQITATHKTPSVTSFSVIITCPDPLKYGRTIRFERTGDGRIQVENPGSEPTWPTVTVNGSPTALTLTMGDQTVTWTGSGKETLDIDFNDLAPNYGTMGDNDAFAIPPGTHDITVAVTPDTATVGIHVTPAWR